MTIFVGHSTPIPMVAADPPFPAPRPCRPDRRDFLLGALALAATPARAAAGVIEHVWGTLDLSAPARRVVSLGYTSHDTLLALGVVPVAVRYWYGPGETGVWPWAEPLLDGAKPLVLRGEVSMEQVAALSPDLIVAIGSGITHAEYTVLSRIAPTLMQPAGQSAFSTPWDLATRMMGRATGREPQAEALIEGVRRRFAQAAARNPHWAGQSGAAAYHWAGTSGVFLPGDGRAEFLSVLGFAVPDRIAALAGNGLFFADLSPEDLSPLDADVLVWISFQDTDPDLAALPMRRTLRAWQQGREVFAGPLLAGAMAHASVLSMPFALDALEADLAAAADGDPATPVASAVAAGLAG
ncbi:MAG: ABC transporter substrate-binding protein [Paracoccaceae bacterium]